MSRLGLGTYLALCLAALLVTLTLVIVQIVGIKTGDELKASIGNSLGELAFQTTDKLDRGMFERYREVQLMAGRSMLADPAVSLDDKRRSIEQMQATYPSYAWIGVTDGAGKVLVSTGRLLEGADVSKRPWFNDALRDIYLHDVHEAVLLAKLLPNPSKEPKRFLDVAFPYHDAGGKVAGVLGAHLSWQWAGDVERSIFRPLAARSKVDTLIVAKDGLVLLGPAALVGSTISTASFNAARQGGGYVTERWPDDTEYLVGFSKSAGHLAYPGLGWTVLVRQELDDAYRPLVSLQRTILGIGLFAALLFSLIGFMAARRITQPVSAIAAAASAIENGQASTIDLGGDNYREANMLARALNSLVAKLAENQASLRQLNASLEERVATRTAELARAQQRLTTIADNMPAAILYIDRALRFRFVNQTYLNWHGLSAAQLKEKSMPDMFSGGGAGGAAALGDVAPFVERALAGERVVFEVVRNTNGVLRHMELTYVPDSGTQVGDGMDSSDTGNSDSAGGGAPVPGFYAMIQDITDRKNLQLHFEHHALHDALTGLPNRKAFMERLEVAIARAGRNGTVLAVMFLDLNKFKQINDVYGHAAGDKVLVRFAGVLRHCVRKTDTVARLAGDEFVIMVEDLTGGEQDAVLVAEKIMAALAAPIAPGSGDIAVSSSIGIAALNKCGSSAEELLARADLAMYQSKQIGAGRWSLA